MSNGAISLFLAKSERFTPGQVLVWNTADADQVYEEYKASGVTIVTACRAHLSILAGTSM